MKLVNTYLSLPLRRQLYLGVVAITFLSIMLTGSLVGLFYWSSFKAQVYESQNLRIRTTSQDVNSWLEELLGNLRFYTSIFNNTNISRDEQISMARALLKHNWAIQSVAMYESKDKASFEVTQYDSINYQMPIEAEAYALAINRGEEFISKVFEIDKQPMLTITLPVINADNKTIGVIRAIINLRNMQHLFAVIPHEKYGYSYILDESSRIIANNFDDLMVKKQLKPPYDYFYIMTNSIFKVYRGIDGSLVIGSKNAIQATQWYMVMEYPLMFILSKVWINLCLMFIAFLGSIAAGMLGAFLIYKNIAEPLENLTSVAHEISRGNFDITIKPQIQPEFGKVAAAFNAMNNRLKGVFKDLEYRLDSEKLLSDVAYSFINFDANTSNDYIQLYLRKIGRSIKAECICIYYAGQNGNVFINRVSWHSACAMSEDEPRQIDLERNPWLFYQLNSHRKFIFSNSMQSEPVNRYLETSEELPEWADTLVCETNEYRDLHLSNTQSQICLPFFDAKRLLGFMQLGYAEEKQISEQDFYFLTTLSNVIGTGIMKARISKMLVEEKERLAITLKSIGDAVISTNMDGNIIMMNIVAEQLTGWTSKDAEGKPLSKVLYLFNTDDLHDAHNPVQDVIDSQKICSYKNNLTLKSIIGISYEIELTAAPVKTRDDIMVGTVIVFRDITNQLKTEREYFNIQKLEAVSYLSAGLAHDFNNLLFVISGNIDLAMDDIPRDSKVAVLLERAQESCLKGSDITNQLLTFAKQGVLITGTSDILTRLEHVVELFVSKSRASVTYNIEPDLPLINMADGIVHQIITNIIINAMQSIKDRYGELSITAEIRRISDADCLPLNDGDYISMHIIDNGEGVSPENLPKLFIPYYTTKETGTGLGLPTVYSLLTRYNGYIRITSRIGYGTDVELLFPIVKPDDQHPAST